MPLVRILVDGFSLLHRWPELAPGKPRHSAAARDELARWLMQYGDAIGTPITVVFDGAGPKADLAPEVASSREFEVIYSKAGQTADDIIEWVAARLLAYGEVLVVSNDYAVRDTVAAVGARVCSCEHFIKDVQFRLSEFDKQLESYNRREAKRYRRG